MKFYLGTHQTDWLSKSDVPLFVSHRRLMKRKTFPRARSNWSLDSNGFSELQLFGEWRTTAASYVQAVKLYSEEIGKLEWASQQDWMCEEFMLKKTGLTVERHQQLTVENFLTLKNLAPELPFIPVLQGWENSDYLRHIERFEKNGVNLFNEKLVGLGSVCRRQSFSSIHSLIRELFGLGLKLHGFGVKKNGLDKIAECLISADSMAWSYGARYVEPLAGHKHKHCGNCFDYAMLWREKIIETISKPRQHWLFY